MIEKIKKIYNEHKTIILELFLFVLIGGINTLVGGILLPHLFQELGLNQVYKIGIFSIDMPIIYGFLVWFTFAYFLQIKFVFKCHFEWKRFLIYPLTQIPNIIINQFLLYFFRDYLKILLLDGLVARVLSAGLALPIMFILVRLVVKPLKSKKEINND